MSFEMVRLDRTSSEPLYQQLYRQIREELETGSFDSSASRVPSSRVLATSLGVSRLTVNEAFSKLLAEGYLQARERSGILSPIIYRQLFSKRPGPQRPRGLSVLRVLPDEFAE